MSLILKPPAKPVFHPVKAACGFYAAEYMLSLVGGEFKGVVPRSTVEAIKAGPTWPEDLVRMLTASGRTAYVHSLQPVTWEGRHDFIREHLRRAKPVAVLVRTKLISLHWFVVCGEEGADLLVYDPREKYGGPSSERKGLAVGNRRIPIEEVYSLWWGSVLFPKHRFVAVVMD